MIERKGNRLAGYDYSQNGANFITICAKDNTQIFGHIRVGDGPLAVPHVQLSHNGKIVDTFIQNIPKTNDALSVPHYVIMPNHVHLILVIQAQGSGTPRAASPTVAKVVNALKGLSSKKAGFSLWQRSYHDHIIRNEKSYLMIAEYIENNPAQWAEDRYFTGKEDL